MMLVKLRTAPPLTRIAAELSTDSTVAAAVGRFQPDRVAVFSSGCGGCGRRRRLDRDEHITEGCGRAQFGGAARGAGAHRP